MPTRTLLHLMIFRGDESLLNVCLFYVCFLAFFFINIYVIRYIACNLRQHWVRATLQQPNPLDSNSKMMSLKFDCFPAAFKGFVLSSNIMYETENLFL